MKLDQQVQARILRLSMMRKVIFVFFCLAYAGHGRRVQMSIGGTQLDKPVDTAQAMPLSQMNRLAMLLLGNNHAAAFNPSSFRTRWSVLSPAFGTSRTTLVDKHNVRLLPAFMQDDMPEWKKQALAKQQADKEAADKVAAWKEGAASAPPVVPPHSDVATADNMPQWKKDVLAKQQADKEYAEKMAPEWKRQALEKAEEDKKIQDKLAAWKKSGAQAAAELEYKKTMGVMGGVAPQAANAGEGVATATNIPEWKKLALVKQEEDRKAKERNDAWKREGAKLAAANEYSKMEQDMGGASSVTSNAGPGVATATNMPEWKRLALIKQEEDRKAKERNDEWKRQGAQLAAANEYAKMEQDMNAADADPNSPTAKNPLTPDENIPEWKRLALIKQEEDRIAKERNDEWKREGAQLEANQEYERVSRSMEAQLEADKKAGEDAIKAEEEARAKRLARLSGNNKGEWKKLGEELRRKELKKQEADKLAEQRRAQAAAQQAAAGVSQAGGAQDDEVIDENTPEWKKAAIRKKQAERIEREKEMAWRRGAELEKDADFKRRAADIAEQVAQQKAEEARALAEAADTMPEWKRLALQKQEQDRIATERTEAWKRGQPLPEAAPAPEPSQEPENADDAMAEIERMERMMAEGGP